MSGEGDSIATITREFDLCHMPSPTLSDFCKAFVGHINNYEDVCRLSSFLDNIQKISLSMIPVIQTDVDNTQQSYIISILPSIDITFPHAICLRWYLIRPDKSMMMDSITHYLNGKCNGKSLGWFFNGTLSFIYSCINGKRSGHYMSFHYNGKLSSDGYYDNGKRIGHWVSYSDYGILLSSGCYNAHEMQSGLWNIWDASRRRWLRKMFPV